MAQDIMDMTSIGKYNTAENRDGIRKLYSRYALGSPVLSDAAAEFIIRSYAMEEMYHYYMLETCLQALGKDPGDRGLFMLTVACLKHSKLFYYDEPEGDYPSYTCQPDPETGEMTYLLYSYKRRTLREYRKVYQYHNAPFKEIRDVILASGCRKVALYEVKKTVLNVAEVLDCMDRMDRAVASFEGILLGGIAGKDLFEFAEFVMEGRNVLCALKDGTEAAGKVDNESYDDFEDWFDLDYRPGEFRIEVFHNPDYTEETVPVDLENYDPEDFIQLTDEVREKYVCPEEVLWDRHWMLAGGRLYCNELVYDPVEKKLVFEYILRDYLDSLADIERVLLRTEDIVCVKLCPDTKKDAD